MIKRIITMSAVIGLLITSCVANSNAPVPTETALPPTPTQDPYLSYPQTTTITDTEIYEGPGNLDYEVLATIPSGTEISTLGVYGDFVKVYFPVDNLEGYVWKNLLPDLDPTLNVIADDDVPMKTQDLFRENCMGPFSTIDENGLAIMKNPGFPDGGSFGIHGGSSQLTDKTTLRLKLSTTSTGLGSIWIQDLPSTSYEKEWSHRVLEIKIEDHTYAIRFMDGTGSLGFYDTILDLPENEVLIVDLIGITASKIRLSDETGKILLEIDFGDLPPTTSLNSSALADGLFPYKQMSILCAVNTPSDFIFTKRDIESIPDGKWLESTTTTVPALRELAQKYDIEMMIPMENWLGDSRYFEIYKKDFGVDLLTSTEQPFFWTDIGKYNFEFMDQIINYDLAQNWKVVFTLHNFVGNLPPALVNSNLSRDEYIEILHEYVTTIVSRYKDKVFMWQIAPEAMSFYIDRGDTTVDFWADKIGLEYIEMMFRWAKEADPDGVMMWSDGVYASTGNDRFERMYQMMLTRVKDYKERGVPIDAIGIGGDYYIYDWYNFTPSKENMIKTMKGFAEYGVDIYIPEIEVSLAFMEGTREEKWAYQADVYKMSMDACIESKVCKGIGIFGVRDSDSGLICPEGHELPCPLQPAPEPRIFDDNFQPKPAYWAIVQSLEEHQK